MAQLQPFVDNGREVRQAREGAGGREVRRIGHRGDEFGAEAGVSGRGGEQADGGERQVLRDADGAGAEAVGEPGGGGPGKGRGGGREDGGDEAGRLDGGPCQASRPRGGALERRGRKRPRVPNTERAVKAQETAHFGENSKMIEFRVGIYSSGFEGILVAVMAPFPSISISQPSSRWIHAREKRTHCSKTSSNPSSPP